MQDIYTIIEECAKDEPNIEIEEMQEIEHAEVVMSRVMLGEAERESMELVAASEVVANKLEGIMQGFKVLLHSKEKRLLT